MLKIAIYTVITNNYDTLKKPLRRVPEYDYFCITDNPDIDQTYWKYMPIDCDSLKNDPKRLSREPKILAHKYFQDYDYSVYVDASLRIIGNLKEIVNPKLPIALIKHGKRDCVYQEAEACKRRKKDDPKTIDKQMDLYKKYKYPKNNGLLAGRVIMRQHNNIYVMLLMEEWFDHVKKYSRRDQLSFNFVAKTYKNDLQIKYIIKDGSPEFNKNFMFQIHREI